jgi:chitodextrinase
MWNAASTLVLRRAFLFSAAAVALSLTLAASANGVSFKTAHGTLRSARKLSADTLLATMATATNSASFKTASRASRPVRKSTDTQSPSTPTALSLSGASANSVSFAWSASTDNVGVAGYELYLNGSKVGTTTATSYGFAGLSCGTSYTLAVAAYDAAGNRSPQASVLASTSPCADTVAPTTPGSLFETGAAATSISLSWAPSLDNVGVAGYSVYLDGNRAGTTTFTVYTVGNLACGKSYTLAVDAYDAAGNRSAQSSVVAATAPCALAHSTFTAAADSYVSQVNPDTAHGSYSYLRVLSGSGTTRTSYLRFDLAGLGGTVTDATLKLYPTSGSSAGFDLHAEPDSSWQESGLTWNNAPAFASAVSASSGPLSAGGWATADVTPLVSGNGSVSFALTTTDSSGFYLDSRESAYAPQLEVTTSGGGGDTQAPTAPSALSLSGSSANSVSFAWSASTDNVGVAGYELYLNGSKVGTTTASSYSFAGLSCGTSYTLGVAAYDAAGNRSPLASLSAQAAACSPLSGTSPDTGLGLVAFGGTLQQALSTHASDYSYVVLGSDYSVAQPLPGKTLHYQDGTAVNSQWNDGIPYSEASANGWLLKDSAGNYIHVYGDSSRYLLDVGNPSVQQAYVNDTISTLQAHPGIDGIEMDNIQTDIGSITRGIYPAKYPSLSAFQNAEVSFLAAVGPALRKAGYYLFANAGGYVNDSTYDSGQDTNAFWARIAPSLGGLMNEYWMQNANNPSQLMDDSGAGFMHMWSGWQKLVTTAQAGGADFLGVSIGSSSDMRTMRFGKGSFLLDWDGQDGAFLYAVAPAFTSAISPWNTAWTTDVGTPTGPKYQIATKVWRRDFSKGSVVVNPTANSMTTTVNGTSYTIAPTDALILAN